jgi:sulfide:quinone oxidoreductase
MRWGSSVLPGLSPYFPWDRWRAQRPARLRPGSHPHASCPLTTAHGKAIIAEFIYGGKVTPTLPILNPGKERWIGWWIKVSFLPIMYWQYMLKGYEWFPKHNTAFKEPTVG